MSIAIRFDDSKLIKSMKDYAALVNKDAHEVLRDEMRLVTRSCMQITAPSYGKGTSKAAQKLGENAVERDIRRVFVSTEKLVESLRDRKLADRIRGYVSSGNVEALHTVFRNFKTKLATDPIQRTVNPGTHTQARDRRGRVSKNAQQTIILDTRSLDAYIKLVKKHVGRAKAGWLAAARYFRVKGIPTWVSIHPEVEGSRIDNRIGDKTTVGAVNRNKAIGDLEAQQSIVTSAFQGRERSLIDKIKRITDRAAGKFNRK